MLTAALAIIPIAQLGPVDRLNAYFAAAKHLKVSFTCTATGYPPGNGTFVWSKPQLQTCLIKAATERAEMIQLKDGTLFINHAAKSYWEYRAFKALLPPSEDVELLGMYYPYGLAALLDTAPKPKWKQAGSEQVAGQNCDKLTATVSVGGEGAASVYYVNIDGKVLRIDHHIESPNGVTDMTYLLTGHDTSDPALASRRIELPVGYMPARIPFLNRPVLVGENMRLGKVTDQKSGSSVDLAAKYKGKKYALLVTAPDCAASKAGESAWAEIRKSLEAQGASVIEVSVGSEPPANWSRDSGRTLYWDKSGEFEEAAQPASTPWVYFVNEEGVMVQGWAGYAADQKSKLLKLCKTVFSQPKED